MYTAEYARDFVVGFTNSDPTPWSPTAGTPPLIDAQCGQYSGIPPAGTTVTVQCAAGLPDFRYVIIWYQVSTDMRLCEVEVMVPGT